MDRVGRTADAAATRNTILAAATTLFGERDYPATSVRDIAKSVGMLPGSLYGFVDSKEEILYAIVRAGVDQFVAALDGIDDGPADVRLRQAIATHMRLVAENPARVRIVFHQWRYLNSDNRLEVIASRQRYERFYRDCLHSGMASGIFRRDLDVQYAVFSILGALNWAPEWLGQDAPDATDQATRAGTRGEKRPRDVRRNLRGGADTIQRAHLPRYRDARHQRGSRVASRQPLCAHQQQGRTSREGRARRHHQLPRRTAPHCRVE
ncbi:hypothetical protein CJ179_47325 [Rhodococcus sp. ACS1]|nr:hypothetical protein CJ179_47325 [Rhodococcus sp. ACS1]